MSHLRILLLGLGLLGSLGARNGAAQDAPAPPPVPGEVVLVKLATPIYPDIARWAHIMGEVVVELKVRSDGAVEDVRLIKSIPLLDSAVLKSVQQSILTCRGCGDRPSLHLLTYSFSIQSWSGDPLDCDVSGKQQDVKQVGDRIEVNAPVPCAAITCDPARVRAAKCLWLWRCGVSDACEKLAAQRAKTQANQRPIR